MAVRMKYYGTQVAASYPGVNFYREPKAMMLNKIPVLRKKSGMLGERIPAGKLKSFAHEFESRSPPIANRPTI